jgi:hypothetical protein
MSSFAGGGGGAIYEDGDPISVSLKGGESTTVPAGETWAVTVTVSGQARIAVNGARLAEGGTLESLSTETVLTEGDTVEEQAGNNGGHIGGWAV